MLMAHPMKVKLKKICTMVKEDLTGQTKNNTEANGEKISSVVLDSFLILMGRSTQDNSETTWNMVKVI